MMLVTIDNFYTALTGYKDSCSRRHLIPFAHVDFFVLLLQDTKIFSLDITSFHVHIFIILTLHLQDTKIIALVIKS